MKNLKLNQIEKDVMSKNEMNQLRGGGAPRCGCACQGSSSKAQNDHANDAGGLISKGCYWLHVIEVYNEDGTSTLCDRYILVTP